MRLEASGFTSVCPSEFIWSVVKPIMNHKLDPSGNQQVNTLRWDKVFSG
jgi:hypothetical protein